MAKDEVQLINKKLSELRAEIEALEAAKTIIISMRKGRRTKKRGKRK